MKRAYWITATLMLTSCSSIWNRDPAGSLECDTAGVHSAAVDENGPRVQEYEGVIHSVSLNRDVPYWVLMPVVESASESKNLPVVYFLHGRNENRFMFRKLGGVLRYQNYLRSDGKPFAIVGLEGRADGRDLYWVDEVGRKNEKGEVIQPGLAWASMLMKELLPEVERRHHIGGSSRKRMIAGISMGSAGAFQLSAHFPKLFRCAAGHSLAIRTAESAVREFPIAFGSIEDYPKNDPIALLSALSKNEDRPIERAWIDIGGKDSEHFLMRAREMQSVLLELGFNNSTGSRSDVGVAYPEGGHNAEYWTQRLPEYLNWYGACF